MANENENNEQENEQGGGADADKKETITLETPAAEQAPEPKPTRAALEKLNWRKSEIDAAIKNGMAVEKEEEKKDEQEQGGADKKGEGAAKPAKKEGEPAARTAGLEELDDLSEAQEKALLEAFGPGTQGRALYFRQKNERRQRQKEAAARQAAEKRAHDLEAELAALKKGGAQAQETDENGNPIDPEEQPLTLKMLKAHRQKEFEEQEAARKEQEARQAAINESHVEQEEYVRSIHADFDDVVKHAREIIKNPQILQDGRARAKAQHLMQSMYHAAMNADKLGLDDWHAAFIAYELGSLHPEHGKAASAEPAETGTSKIDPKGAGTQQTGALKRAMENTQRRQPSAAVPAGGGPRTIAVEDVDLKTLLGMNHKQRSAFREKYPAQYDKLMRG